MSQARQILGASGELVVAQWYENNGYSVIGQNWHCSEGEIDLILRRGRTTVFCEVKTRTDDSFGAPVEAVNNNKQWKVRKSATRWLTQVDAPMGGEIRFDVAAVNGDSVLVIEDAF